MSNELNFNPLNDKNKDLRKLKICIIVLALAMFFSGFFCAKAYAADTYQTWNNYNPSPVLTADYPYQCIEQSTSGTIYLFCAKDKIAFFSGYTKSSGISRQFKYSAGTWVNDSNDQIAGYMWNTSGWTILEANYDIYSDSACTTVFFSQQSALAQALAQAHPQQVLQQVVGILPIVIVCLVGYLALRKGLALLQEILHQA